MEIKGKVSIKEYHYVVMFDLASYTTGVCVWDIKKNEPAITKVLKVKNTSQLAIADLEEEIKGLFDTLMLMGIHSSEIIVACEAMPMQAGKFTTIKTLLSLAQAHAVLNLYCHNNHIDVYDYIGIAPASWRAHYKRIMNLSPKTPVTKEDINAYVTKKYNIQYKLTCDESDAVFLCVTLMEYKYNEDIKDLIREEKRHKKNLKAKHAIQAADEKIAALEKLKI